MINFYASRIKQKSYTNGYLQRCIKRSWEMLFSIHGLTIGAKSIKSISKSLNI